MNLNSLNNFLNAYWDFNETSGNRIDFINNIPLYETEGTVTYKSGKNKNCSYFNGQAYLYSPNMSYFSGSDGFLLSMWVFFDSEGTNYTSLDYNADNCYIIEKLPYFSIYTQTLNNTRKWMATVNGINLSGNTWLSADTEKWYHVLLGASNNILFFSARSNVGFYYTTSTYTSLSNTNSDFIIGRTMKGRIDETAFWYNTQITSIDEFKNIENELYQNNRGIFYNSFKDLWENYVTVNSVISYPPISINPEINRPDSLKDVITYSYTPIIAYGNNASNNKATTNSIDSFALSFNTLAPGETSTTYIIRLEVPNAIVIRNIKLGLIETDPIKFAQSTFGIETRNYLDYNIIPEHYYQGLSSNSTSSYNIDIPNSTRTLSYYVYLNIIIPRNSILETGIIKYKWYFDYA